MVTKSIITTTLLLVLLLIKHDSAAPTAGPRPEDVLDTTYDMPNAAPASMTTIHEIDTQFKRAMPGVTATDPPGTETNSAHVTTTIYMHETTYNISDTTVGYVAIHTTGQDTDTTSTPVTITVTETISDTSDTLAETDTTSETTTLPVTITVTETETLSDTTAVSMTPTITGTEMASDATTLPVTTITETDTLSNATTLPVTTITETDTLSNATTLPVTTITETGTLSNSTTLPVTTITETDTLSNATTLPVTTITETDTLYNATTLPVTTTITANKISNTTAASVTTDIPKTTNTEPHTSAVQLTTNTSETNTSVSMTTAFPKTAHTETNISAISVTTNSSEIDTKPSVTTYTPKTNTAASVTSSITTTASITNMSQTTIQSYDTTGFVRTTVIATTNAEAYTLSISGITQSVKTTNESNINPAATATETANSVTDSDILESTTAKSNSTPIVPATSSGHTPLVQTFSSKPANIAVTSPLALNILSTRTDVTTYIVEGSTDNRTNSNLGTSAGTQTTGSNKGETGNVDMPKDITPALSYVKGNTSDQSAGSNPVNSSGSGLNTDSAHAQSNQHAQNKGFGLYPSPWEMLSLFTLLMIW